MLCNQIILQHNSVMLNSFQHLAVG